MMRAVLAIMAGILCGVLGHRQARRIQSDNARIRRWEQLLRHLCLLLNERSLSLPDAFRQTAQTNSEADAFLLRLADTMVISPLTPLEELASPMGPEAPILARLMTNLSRGTLESRLLATQQAAQEMALLSSATMERSAQDARMWATLGWTCGACITLLLI